MSARTHDVLGLPRFFEFVQRDPRADLLVITNMWPEAARPVYGIFVQRQVQALRAAGVRCDVLYLRGYVSKIAYVLGVPLFLWLTLSWRHRYRLTHIHAGETALAARFLLRRPMITTYHGDDMLGYRGRDGSVPLLARLRSLLVRRHACLFTATVTQSAEMHRRLPRCIQHRDTVIRCGVDAAQFSPGDQGDARRTLGWSDSERIVLFAATRPRYPLKRLDLAREVVTSAESELGPIRLVIAENVAPETMPVMMNAADCLLLTSMSEGSPMVIKEALMCNLPIVATDVGDIRDMLVDVSPSAVCPHEPSELSAAVVGVLRANRRSNGRSQSANLNQSTTTRRLLGVYAALGVTPDPSTRETIAVTPCQSE
jgi:teichuronic acid biosynthesis glycosyltransferase TuaC